MDRPNFLVVGAAKAGTTTLDAVLEEHPDVCMSRPKEPNFFDVHYDKGLAAYWRDHFSHWTAQRAVGEATATYFHLRFVAQRAARDLPGARIIVSLRNPIDRAHSAWWMVYAYGREHRTFEAAILQELEWLAAGVDYLGDHGEWLWRARALAPSRETRGLPPYLAVGQYAAILQVWFAGFSRDRVKVVLFDDLRGDARKVVRDIWTFLDVDPGVAIPDVRPRNTAASRWARPLYRFATLRGLARAIVPRRGRQQVRQLARRLGTRPAMDARTRALLVDYYRPHNRALEALLNRDFSHWDR